jgi:general secretion pathway protein F
MADLLDHSVTEALRSLRVQLDAGVDVSQALMTSATVCRTAGAINAFSNASTLAQKGEGFEAVVHALREHISDGERAVMLAGFKSGRTDECLEAVVEQRELWHQARSQIRSGMVLPMLTLIAAAFIAPLPGLFQEGATIFGYLFSATFPLILAFLMWQVMQRFMETRNYHGQLGPNWVDSLLLQAPLVGGVEQKKNLSDFSSLLGLQLNAGVAMPEALDVCSRCMQNGFYRIEAQRLAQVTRKGSALSENIKVGMLWPQEFAASLTAGEKAGAIDEQLKRYARHAREAYTRAIKQFAEWLPRIIYGIVALFMIWNILKIAFAYFGMLDSLMKPQ